MRRRFNSRERVALFLAAQGCCEYCGHVLDPDWHADHHIPFVAGGPTDAANGRASCPFCNRTKGAKDARMDELRTWQQRAIAAYERQNAKDFLLTATPGAGKTTCALAIAETYLRSGRVQRIVIVVPTTHLRRQWRRAAAARGIHLSAEFANMHGREAQDYQGVVLTYHQVASIPVLHRRNCATPTFVILDEPHHAGHDNSWGDALLEAFGLAERRLLITGTAFRSDNIPIPFVRYEDQRSIPDFSYSYEQALQDEVCRAIFFPSFEGRMRWWTEDGEQQATFADALSEAERARRYRTALSVRGEWLSSVLREADHRLNEVREYQYPLAGGLIIASDQHHAREIAELLERIAGETPVLAISEEEDSSDAITAFAASTQKWLVSVKMVSEGVDIPRLCVGVYATNVLTELYFRQVVGRFVRQIDDVVVQGWLYIAKEPTLVEYVRRIQEERDHVLIPNDDTPPIDPPLPPGPGGGEGGSPSAFSPLGSQAEADNIYYEQNIYSQAELSEAKALLLAAGVRTTLDAVTLVKVLRVQKHRPHSTEDPAPPPPSLPVLEVQKRQLRNDLKTMVGIFVAATDLEFPQANYLLKVVTGKAADQRTLPELALTKTTLQHWIHLTQQENAPNGYDAWLSLARRNTNRAA